MKEAKKEALRWFLQSQDDFQFVEWVHRENLFFDKGCFMAQQGGEKCLKACLYARGERRVIGHSLFEMSERLKKMDASFSAILDAAKRLDRFYITARYPNGLPGGAPFQIYTKADLDQAVSDLRSIFNLCRNDLESLSVLSEDPTIVS